MLLLRASPGRGRRGPGAGGLLSAVRRGGRGVDRGPAAAERPGPAFPRPRAKRGGGASLCAAAPGFGGPLRRPRPLREADDAQMRQGRPEGPGDAARLAEPEPAGHRGRAASGPSRRRSRGPRAPRPLRQRALRREVQAEGPRGDARAAAPGGGPLLGRRSMRAPAAPAPAPVPPLAPAGPGVVGAGAEGRRFRLFLSKLFRMVHPRHDPSPPKPCQMRPSA